MNENYQKMKEIIERIRYELVALEDDNPSSKCALNHLEYIESQVKELAEIIKEAQSRGEK